jgi:hypothetical protein
MTRDDANGNRPTAAGPDALVVVRVDDAVNPILAGHAGCSYASPPQPRDQALTLAGLLLGCPVEPVDGGSPWTCPLAGGRRTVTIEPG